MSADPAGMSARGDRVTLLCGPTGDRPDRVIRNVASSTSAGAGEGFGRVADEALRRAPDAAP